MVFHRPGRSYLYSLESTSPLDVGASSPPPISLGGGEVPPVQCYLRNQHVAQGSPWIGEVSLIQYDDGVPDMQVK